MLRGQSSQCSPTFRHDQPQQQQQLSPLKTPLQHLDESDATSLTTTCTTATPSPSTNSASEHTMTSIPSSMDSSPSSSADEKTWGKLTSLLSPPRRVQSEPTSSLEASPNNCLNITPQHPNTSADNIINESGDWSDESDDYDAHWVNSQTPLRRGSPWGIQTALFRDEETENHIPVLGQKAPRSAPMHPCEDEDARPNSYPSSSPPDYAASHQPIQRTRRSRVVSSRVGDQGGFLVPEHRRRNSASKYRASPQPLPSSSSLLRGSPHRTQSCQSSLLSSSGATATAPPSNSKSKKYKQQQQQQQQQRRDLDLPGLMDDRVDVILTSRSSGSFSVGSNSIATTPSPSLLCRLRLTTIVWGLLIIGLTSLTRVAMLTSHWEAFSFPAEKPTSDLPLPTTPQVPTAGLRGSLLLATVGRHKSSPSQDPPVKKKKKKVIKPPQDHEKKKKKATTDKKPKPTTTATKDKKKKDKPSSPTTKKDKVKSSTKLNIIPPPHKTSVVAQPPPLDPADAALERVAYPDHDAFMFDKSSQHHTNNNKAWQRVITLHDDVQLSNQRKVTIDLFPAEFTDNTQYYGQDLDSNDDERLRKMELREPYSQGECVPMQKWQTTYHPFCNGVHELGVEYLGEPTTETNVELFGVKGYWRYAWRLDLRKQQAQEYGDTVVLKTLKFRHDFEDAHFEHDRIDAVAMERLTSSPHVINVFGFCGHSVLTEYANGPRLGELADKSKSKPLARLRIARDIADGLADVHGIDDKDGNNATFVHLDINPANVVSIGSSLKLNDFNIGIIRRWNTTSQKPCGFPAQYPNPQWRSPEESRNEQNLTEKVDVFSLGHIFFRLICGHEPWNKLEPGGKPSKEAINAKVQQGQLPFIPETVMKSTDPEVSAIRDAMLDCYRTDPNERPSAREISQKLQAVLEKLAAGKESPRPSH